MTLEDVTALIQIAVNDLVAAQVELGQPLAGHFAAPLLPRAPKPIPLGLTGSPRQLSHRPLGPLEIHPGANDVEFTGRGWRRSPTAAVDDVIAAARSLREVLRALRRIQAATAWCRARREGQERAACEVEQQQHATVTALNAELTQARLLGRVK